MYAFFKGRFYYKLVETSGYNNLEISGIKMYPNKNTTPDEVSKKKISLLKLKNTDVVLDICTGLGYTAQFALQFGASKVISIEKDINVIEIAKFNPYSQGFFDGIKQGRIKSIIGDAAQIVKILPVRYFTAIVCDPPRYGRAKELYSKEFCKYLFLLLKNKGRLFYYVGKPSFRYRGKNLLEETKRKLKEVGFLKISVIKELNSLLAYKLI